MNHPRPDPALLAAVIAWRNRPASADLRGLPVVNVPVLGRLSKVLPDDAAPRTLAAAYAASVRLSQPQSVLRQAGAASLAELRTRPLAQCDALASRLARQSGWLAGGSGAALGVVGAAGLVADAPAVLLIGLRALVRIGYCYGETPSPALVTALFALASADTEAEKQRAWQAAVTAPSSIALATHGIADAALRDGLERAAEREFAKQALTGSLQKLATTLVQRLGMGKVAGVLPLLGALVGGAVNIRFVYLLGEAARMAFAARRLAADGVALDKLLLPAPLPAVAKPAAVKRRKVAAARRRPSPAP